MAETLAATTGRLSCCRKDSRAAILACDLLCRWPATGRQATGTAASRRDGAVLVRVGLDLMSHAGRPLTPMS